jgi:hypothetical protein
MAASKTGTGIETGIGTAESDRVPPHITSCWIDQAPNTFTPLLHQAPEEKSGTEVNLMGRKSRGWL